MSMVRVMYALVAAVFSMCGIYLAGRVRRAEKEKAEDKDQENGNDGDDNKDKCSCSYWFGSVRVYAVFRGFIAPPMILAHLIYLWPMRFNTESAEELTLAMGRGQGRNAGATTYTILYQWLCNGMLPFVLHWGMHIMLKVKRGISYHPSNSNYPFGLELFANGLFAVVILARFLSVFASALFSINLRWFYLAWAEPWPTVQSSFWTDKWAVMIPPLAWIFVWFFYKPTRIERQDLVTFSRILAK